MSANYEVSVGQEEYPMPDVQVGHKWSVRYDASKEQAFVDVSIVFWNKGSYKLASRIAPEPHLVRTFEPKTDVTSDEISFETDLASLILETYSEAKINGKVDEFELYPALSIELIAKEALRPLIAGNNKFEASTTDTKGSLFNLTVDGTPPAITYNINYNSGHIVAAGKGDVRRKRGIGIYLDYALSTYSFWNKQIGQQDLIKCTSVEGYLWNGDHDPTHMDKFSLDNFSQVKLNLDKTQYWTLTNHRALDQFIVDPKGFGSGGGSGGGGGG